MLALKIIKGKIIMLGNIQIGVVIRMLMLLTGRMLIVINLVKQRLELEERISFVKSYQ